MVNPNSRLLNLFGGGTASPKKRKLSGESGGDNKGGNDEYNFSESSQEDLRRRQKQ